MALASWCCVFEVKVRLLPKIVESRDRHMLSAKKRSLMPRHFVPFGYFPDSSHCGRGAAALQGGGGGCQCHREAPFKKWVVGPPPSIFASFHSAYRGSSLLLLPRFRCLLFSIIVKLQPKHGTFHNLEKSFLKKNSSCFYVFARFLIQVNEYETDPYFL